MRLLMMTMITLVGTSALAVQASGQLRIEGGLGHSALFTDIDFQTSFDATEQFIVPNIKLAYGIPISKLILLVPFLGYGESGGARTFFNRRNHYRIQAIETGILGEVRISKFSAGVGLRGDIIARATSDVPVSGGGNFLPFHRYALTGGLRFDVTVAGRVPVGLESWYNLTNLYDNRELRGFSLGSYDTRSHTIRIVVGYIFDSPVEGQ